MQDRLKRREIWPLDSLDPPMGKNYCYYPKRRSDVNVRVVDGETVVLDRQAGLIHQLHQTASFVWDQCDGESTIPEIADQLAEVYEIDSETAARDVVSVVGQLHSLNLLEPQQK